MKEIFYAERIDDMAIFKIRYRKECEHIMEVEADNVDEAKKKYENFDCIRDYEIQGISEEVISIEKAE